MSMRAGSVIREAYTTVLADIWRHLTIVIITSLTFLGGAFIEGTTAAQIRQTFNEAVADGADLIMVTDASGGTIETSSCVALADGAGIEAAGAIRQAGIWRTSTAPKVAFRGAYVSAGFIAAAADWHGQIKADAVLLGAALAKEIGLTAKSFISVTDSSGQSFTDIQVVEAVIDLSLRAPEYERSLLIMGLGERADECWISARPNHRRQAATAAAAMIRSDSNILKTSVLTAEESVVALNPWSKRPTRLLWIAVGTVTSLLLSLLWLSRRREIALRQIVGSTAIETVLQVSVEICLTVTTAAIVAAAWCWSLLALTGQMNLTTGLAAGRALLQAAAMTGLTGPLLGIILASQPLGRALRQR